MLAAILRPGLVLQCPGGLLYSSLCCEPGERDSEYVSYAGVDGSALSGITVSQCKAREDPDIMLILPAWLVTAVAMSHAGVTMPCPASSVQRRHPPCKRA